MRLLHTAPVGLSALPKNGGASVLIFCVFLLFTKSCVNIESSISSQKTYPIFGDSINSFRVAEPVANIRWSSDERYLLGADNSDKTIYLWEAGTGRQIWKYEKNYNRPTDSIEFTNDGQFVVTGFGGDARQNPESVLTIISASTGKLVRHVNADNNGGFNLPPNFSISEKTIAVLLGDSGRIAVIDTDKWLVKKYIGPLSTKNGNIRGFTTISLSTNDNIIVAGNLSGEVKIIDLLSGTVINSFKSFSVSSLLHLSYNDKTKQIFTGGDLTVQWDSTGYPAPGQQLDLSKGNREDPFSLVRGWDTGGTALGDYKGPRAQPHEFSITKAGDLLASAGAGAPDKGFLSIWENPSGRLIGTIESKQIPRAVSFSPDGRKLAFSSGASIHIISINPPQ